MCARASICSIPCRRAAQVLGVGGAERGGDRACVRSCRTQSRSSGADDANASRTCDHASGFGMSLPSTMNFDVSSSAAASPSVGQHQPRANSTSSLTTRLRRAWDRAPSTCATAPTPAPVHRARACAHRVLLREHERGDDRRIVLDDVRMRRSRTSGAGSSRPDRTATSSPIAADDRRLRRPVPCSGSRCSRTSS